MLRHTVTQAVWDLPMAGGAQSTYAIISWVRKVYMKKSRKANWARRLGIEGLERRELLAGNVLVEVSRGVLKVTGDGSPNHITIYQQTNGRFTISGLDDEVFTGPTTNILARNITVNLGAGDDSVVIAAQPIEAGSPLVPANVLGVTSVNGGDGGDIMSVSIVGQRVGTFTLPALALTIDGGAAAANTEALQNDSVLIFDSSAGLMTVRTGAGDDLIDVTNVTALTLNVESGGSTTNGLTDVDAVSISDVTALSTAVNLGLNSSDNFLTVSSAFVGTFSATGGNGIDNVLLSNSRASTSLSLATNGGNDVIALDLVQTGLTQADYPDFAAQLTAAFGIDISTLPINLFGLISFLPSLPGLMTISAGEGDDVVTATDVYSTFGLYIYLDGGNDNLFATTVESDYFAWFFGGAGTDGRLLTGINALSELELQFETVLAPPNPPAA